MNGGIDLVATSLDDFKEMRIRYGQLVGMPFLAECYSQAGDVETSLSTANDALQLLLEKLIKRDAAMTLELFGPHLLAFGPQQTGKGARMLSRRAASFR